MTPDPKCEACIAERPVVRDEMVRMGVEDKALIERLSLLAACREHRRPVGITGRIPGPEA